jgi:hypothetical protein
MSGVIMSCKKHLDHVKGWDGSLEELVEAIGGMRYDRVVRFLDLLEDEFFRQALADYKRKRIKLSACLKDTALHLRLATLDMEEAWKICKPHMKDHV